MKRFVTYFTNPLILMKDFIEIAKKKKIGLEKRKVKDFGEVKTKVIFNCAGLGAKELVNDKDVFPTLGHLITLRS